MPKKVREDKKIKKEEDLREKRERREKREKELQEKREKKEKERQEKMAKKESEKFAGCPLCFKAIVHAEMNNHLRGEHVKGVSPLTCVWPDCGMTYKEGRGKAHMRSHTHPEAHPCMHFHPTSEGRPRSCKFMILERVQHGLHHEKTHGINEELLSKRGHRGDACPCVNPGQKTSSPDGSRQTDVTKDPTRTIPGPTVLAEASTQAGGEKLTEVARICRPKATLRPVSYTHRV